jgi:ZIP family zinc transporter
MRGVLGAGLLGFVAASSLVVGAALGSVQHLAKRTVGLVMGFGAGALISAVSFELVEEAIALGGTLALTAGLALGALVYFFAARSLERMAKTRGEVGDEETSGLEITVGAGLDGIPESVILGTSLVGGGSVPLAFFAAVLVSNLPEGIAAGSDLSAGGEPRRRIVLRFLWIALASGVAAALGYALFDGLDPRALAVVQAFAAGGLLTMVMDRMAPEAFADAGLLSGLIAVAGFELAFLLSNGTG